MGLLAVGFASAQEGNVGINTSTPQATLEVQPTAANLAGTTNEGIIAPKLTKERIAAIATPVEGTLVYATDATYAGTNSVVAKIDDKGYYFYNGTEWVKANGGGGASASYTGSTSVVLNGSSFERAALTGDVLADQNSNATTIAANAVTTDKIANATILAEDLNQMGATTYQTLTWTGTKWEPVHDTQYTVGTISCTAATLGWVWAAPDGTIECTDDGARGYKLQYKGTVELVGLAPSGTVIINTEGFRVNNIEEFNNNITSREVFVAEEILRALYSGKTAGGAVDLYGNNFSNIAANFPTAMKTYQANGPSYLFLGGGTMSVLNDLFNVANFAILVVIPPTGISSSFLSTYTGFTGTWDKTIVGKINTQWVRRIR